MFCQSNNLINNNIIIKFCKITHDIFWMICEQVNYLKLFYTYIPLPSICKSYIIAADLRSKNKIHFNSVEPLESH